MVVTDIKRKVVVVMLEKMTFPETVEEFMDEYKIIDSDEVYTNGTALVPIFRMNQWFEHMKGEWIYPYGDKHYKRCSFCGREHYHIPWNAKFCSFCGAQMKGGNDDDQ